MTYDCKRKAQLLQPVLLHLSCQFLGSQGTKHTVNVSVCVVQDLLVASLFRNFLLAERIMRASACSPISYPRLPPTHHHTMWQAWDMAAEMCLLQLPQ